MTCLALVLAAPILSKAKKVFLEHKFQDQVLRRRMVTKNFTWIVYLFSLVFISPCHLKKHKHPVPTYFHRFDSNGKTIDRSKPSYNEVFKTKFINKISSLDSVTASLKISPFEIENGGQVSITWLGIVAPNASDWIGFYCPENETATRPLDYFHVTEGDEETWQSGYGSKNVTLFNMRTNCEFRYYRHVNGGLYTSLVVRSNLLNFVGGVNIPNHGHIELTGDPTQMRVMWISGNADTPVVNYSSSEDDLTQNVSGTSKTYRGQDMCGPPATWIGFHKPGYIHDVLLVELHPATRYYYSFGSKKGMSPIYNFTTALPAGDKTPYKFIAYGDMGVDGFPKATETALRMVEEYRDNDIKLIFHNGDISYARGYAYLWDQWHTIIQPYSTLIPYMVGMGNHEQDHLTGGSKDPSGALGEGYHPSWGNFGDDSGGECGVPMYYRFRMPQNGNALWWYSYDYGLVHFIMISTENDFSPGSRQYKWLEMDLKKIDRKKTPWVIVGGHRAMYASQDELSDFFVAENMQRLFEDILYRYKVDIAFWAHYHSYERTCKLYRNTCVEDGITHLVVGTAGKQLDIELWMYKKWSLVRLMEYGYGRVTVYNQTAMMFEFVRNNDGAVLDKVILEK